MHCSVNFFVWNLYKFVLNAIVFIKMFGVIVAGRLVQTDFQQMDATHAVFSLNNAETINHIIIFLTGQVAFPENFAGAVYYSLPNGDPLTSWQYLGYVSNEKPSAIFRVSKLKTPDIVDGVTLQGGVVPMFANFHRQDIAQVGISVEPINAIKSLTEAVGVNVSTVDNVVEYTKYMLDNFVNYISSFACKSNETVLKPTESFVPMNSVQTWFENFQRRLTLNPYFWKS